MTKLWLDIKSPSDAHVIAAFHRHLHDVEKHVTVRDRAEAIALAKEYGLPYTAVGKDDPRRFWKIFHYALRLKQVASAVPEWDASLSFNNMNAILLSRLQRKPSITVMDNDLEFIAGEWSLAKKLEMRNNLQATHILVPDVFPLDLMRKLGAESSSITTFAGYKEDLYTADFVPDATFRAQLPFEEYVVLRPEALSAVYVREERSIVPELLQRLTGDGFNIIYLPRVASDRAYASGAGERVWIPPRPLHGLQLAWHAHAVLTGSGSFAREAACLGVPSVSFFPGALLAVDRKMVAEGRVVHSRDPNSILDYVRGARRNASSLARSIETREQVLSYINRALANVRSGQR